MSWFKKLLPKSLVERLIEKGYALRKIKVGNFPEGEAYSKTLQKTGTTIDYIVDVNGNITSKVVTPGVGNRVNPAIHSMKTNYDLNMNPIMATTNYRVPITNEPNVVGTRVSFTRGDNGHFSIDNSVAMPVYHRFL